MDPSEPAAAFLLKAYQRKQISNLAQGRLRCALKLLEAQRRDDRVLVFCDRTEQAAQLRELRACLMEGLPRGDYLLPPQALEKRRKAAENRHGRNYWEVMRGIRGILCGGRGNPYAEVFDPGRTRQGNSA